MKKRNGTQKINLLLPNKYLRSGFFLFQAVTEDFDDEDLDRDEDLLQVEVVEPTLYSWLYKFRRNLVVKFTTCYYDWFKVNYDEARMKENCALLINDVPSK